MSARFVAVFVAFICTLAAKNSEGTRKLEEKILDGGVGVIDKHTAQQAWNYCSKELKDSSEVVKSEVVKDDLDSCIEFDSTLSAIKIIQKFVDGLSLKKKETILNCLREKKIPLQVLKDERGGTSSNKHHILFSSWASIPRRYLRCKSGNHRVLGTASLPLPASSLADSDAASTHHVPAFYLSPVLKSPASAPESSPEPSDNDYSSSLDIDYPSPSNIVYHSQLTEKVSPIPSPNNNRKYLVASVITSSVAGLGLVTLILFLCLKKDQIVEPKDGQRDEKPLLDTSDISAGSSEEFNIMGNTSSINLKAPPTTSGLGADFVSRQAGSQPTEAHAETVGKTVLPLPPGRRPTTVVEAAPTAAAAAAAAPPPPEQPPPPSYKPAASAPPPPPRIGQPPPNPPAPARPSSLGLHYWHTSTGETSEASVESEAPKAKLKPFFWDKVLASPDHSMVWHEIKAGSFQFNEEMMEALFGYSSADKKKHEQRKDSSFESTPQFIQIIDPKKSQNLAILLKALNMTTEEVCSALKEGNELPAEFIQTLLKMAPTTEEELKLRLYGGDLSHIGPAERFLKAVVDIPFAFKRLESLLFLSTFQEEFSSIKDSLAILEIACKELRSSRLFLKLLEAVLKTGNRMNDGTYRGGAQAFKLDTLLKLSDVKGTDGKTTLLNFVVHEIIRGEGLRAARKLRASHSMCGVKTENLVQDSPRETEEYYRSLGLQEVSGLSNELQNVKKAALIDNEILCESVSKLGHARMKTNEFLETEMKDLEEDSEFLDALTIFVNKFESDMAWLIEEEKRIMALVKSTGDYFHGRGGREEGAHLFVIVRDFLLMVDRACLDVKNTVKLPSKTQRKDALPSSPSPSQESPSASTHEIHQRLFPAMRERQIDDEFSSDDES